MHKHTHTIRELAKFFSGLIIADLLVGIWVSSGQGYQSIFLGMPITQSFVNVWIVLDVIIFLLLVHYAWHLKLPAKPKHAVFYIVVGSLLAIVSILHFLRLMYSTPIIAGGVTLPIWLSVLGTIVTGFLSYASFHFARKSNS